MQLRSLRDARNAKARVRHTVKKRLTKIERSKINIESPLNEIIIGLLLGDGHTLKDNVEMVVVDLFMVKVV